MVQIIPFAAWRPTPAQAATFACPPYDVVTRESAAALAPRHRFLHVIRPEIGLPPAVDEDDPQAHALAAAKLQDFMHSGVLVHDDAPMLYVYRQTGFAHTQTGIVACVRVADYRAGVIKQHEKTLLAKEQNRIAHFTATHAQTEPVFLMYRPQSEITELVTAALTALPSYDFTGEDGVRHEFWPLSPASTAALVAAFHRVESLYIADGHHRSASAVKVAGARGLADDDPRASIMAVIFPASDLFVLAYNRIVKDLAGLSAAEFLAALGAAGFTVTPSAGDAAAQPSTRGEFGVYLAATHRWYHARYQGAASGDVIKDLDTAILTDHVLAPILGITDLRTDPHIDFVGGAAGASALEAGAEASGGVAFALFPTSVTDIMAVSDAGAIMPPKSTWFEPKLASGLFIHSLD